MRIIFASMKVSIFLLCLAVNFSDSLAEDFDDYADSNDEFLTEFAGGWGGRGRSSKGGVRGQTNHGSHPNYRYHPNHGSNPNIYHPAPTASPWTPEHKIEAARTVGNILIGTLGAINGPSMNGGYKQMPQGNYDGQVMPQPQYDGGQAMPQPQGNYDGQPMYPQQNYQHY